MFLSILVIPIAFLWIFSSRPSFSSKCSANTGHSFTVEVLPMLCRIEGLLHIFYKLYTCSYIPVRCLSAGAHTQFEPEAFTFHRVAWNWQVFSMKINANVFLGISFHLFPTQDVLVSSEVIQSWKPKQWYFKCCFCVNTHSHKNWYGINRGRGRNEAHEVVLQCQRKKNMWEKGRAQNVLMKLTVRA